MAKSAKKAEKPPVPQTVTIDNEKYSLEGITESARKALNTLQFADRRLAQLNGEIALANATRLGMISILKKELKKAET